MKKSGGLFCFDWQEHGIELMGTYENGGNYRAYDMFAVPCGYQYTAFDGTLQGANNTDCNWDKAALSDYLGSTNLINFFVN